MDDASDSLVGIPNLSDGDNYPDILKLLEIASVPPFGPTEAERAASAIRRLKTAYKSTKASEREGNLNSIQLQSLVEANVLKVADIFMRNWNGRMMQNLPSIIFSTKCIRTH